MKPLNKKVVIATTVGMAALFLSTAACGYGPSTMVEPAQDGYIASEETGNNETDSTAEESEEAENE
ncbi:hypothetical protein [Butyrivibrio sp. INlla16]|uniref:hypothetical protein n=1 Tax=Butyrivibrio sp. INlla16 TaxID=1520807 RepID=UPI0008800246|nr:hypothetical protein [Butyrivibrio sp. INlla16]SDB32736.1 hypothetical protein SAMN02910263_01583 [Butyrivibrio sp. INlla16]